jgi:nucleoside-diphosphate-sugar epimerase
MPSPQLHVVFGAGQIGVPLARLLAGRGHAVRLVSRSGSGSGLPGVAVERADASDPRATAEATRGAAAVYHCMNPRYSAAVWAEQLPRIQESLIAAAGRAGARLVVLDNLYPLGRTGGRPMDEDTPLAPTSRKGEIRARLFEALLAAHRRGEVKAVTGRGADFYGPRGDQTYFNGRFWSGVLRGKPGQVPFDPGMPHTYHYVEDVAAGLAALGEAPEDRLGRAWMLPCAPAEPTQALGARFGAALGRPVRIERIPRLLLKAAGLFVPILRELDEMAYQWGEPFVVDDRRFRAAFGLLPLPPGEAALRTVAWAVEAFGPAARRGAHPTPGHA